SIAGGLIAGPYSVTVTDGNNCSSVESVTISEPTVLISTIVTSSNVNCNGGSDGSAQVGTSGGTGPYSYSWDNGDLDSLAGGLVAGTYIVTTTDGQGCTDSDTITITEPAAPLSTTTASVDNLCFGDAGGLGSVAVLGGTGPYSYSWSPIPGSNDTITGLQTGTYYVLVTDTNGCAITDSIQINDPTLLTMTTATFDVLCNGDTSGFASASGSGGTIPYSYSWSNGDLDSLANNLGEGSYVVTITDLNGCSIDSTLTVNRLTFLQVSMSQTDVSCNGSSNGEGIGTPTGGTLPYTYLWTNADADSIANGITAGSYGLTVTDGNGCTVTDNVTIIEPQSLSVSFTQTDVSCNSGSDGQGSGLVSGGTLPYSYLWSSGSTDSTSLGLIAGTYTLTTTDAQGCVLIDSITITEPPVLDQSFTINHVDCFGGNEGYIVSNVTGGTPGFTYLWSNGNGGDSISLLNSGFYSIIITDAKNCVVNDTIELTQPAAELSLVFNVSDVLCFGGNTGDVEAVVSGGTTPYQYLWNTTATDSLITGLISNTYSVDVTDGNGCSISSTVFVNEPPALITQFSNVGNTFCELPNGQAIITSTGGLGPYDILWSTGDTTALIAGILSGTYTVITTDSNGCVNNDTVTITNIPSPVVTITSSSNVSCFGGNDGEATASGSLGSLLYSYMWAPSGNSNATATNLFAGNHIVTLTDGNGCTSNDTIVITEAPILSISVDTVLSVICFGESNGEAGVGVVGGTGAYSYSWSNADTTAYIDSLQIGFYTVTVTDSLGCVISENVVIPQPPELIATMGVVTNETCIGNFDGTASVLVSGGTPSFVYVWSTVPVQNSIMAIDLAPGTYQVEVTDANGCTDTTSAVIGSPNPVITTAVIGDTICYGDSISITATATGGTGSYVYYWGSTFGVMDTLTVTPFVSAVYEVNAIDFNGCVGTTDSVVVGVESLFQGDLVVFANSPICPGNSSLVYAEVNNDSIGTLNYSWNQGLGPGAGSFQVYPTAPTMYVVSVTNGCGVTVTDSVFVDFKPLPTVSFLADLLFGCEPLEVNFTQTSSTLVDSIISYGWDFGDGGTSTSADPTYVFNTPGVYDVTLTVSTNAGCTTIVTDSSLIEVYEAPLADFTTVETEFSTINNTVEFVDQSISAFFYDWDFGDGNSSTLIEPSNTYDPEGFYTVELIVTSDQGCKDTAELDIEIKEDRAFYVPNTFTPNDDGVNDVFFPQGIGLEKGGYTMSIFNRWGEFIFADSWGIGWNGENNLGLPLKIDTYVWVIVVLDVQNKTSKRYTGHVNLIR
ncbi:MAG: gliding motility-associated-like protein, partial [Parvicellaceae bacterium]